MKHLFSSIFFIVFFSCSVHAQQRVYVNEYLNIGVGGRALAMGGSVTATTGDITAGYWNPAGLMSVRPDFQVGLMHAEYFAGNSKYDYAGIAVPLKSRHRTLGISALRFATDDIAYTIDYVQPDGSFDDSKLKSISAGDYAFLLSYAQDLKLFKKIPAFQTRIGANAKIIYRHIGTMANAWGAGLDLGLQSTYGRWRFGIMAKDVTTTVTAWSFHLTEHEKEVFGQTGNEIPVKSYEVMKPRFALGVGRYFTPQKSKIQLLAEVNADLTTDGRRNTLVGNADLSLDPHAGVELSYKGIVYLRFGVSNFQRVLDDRDTTNQAKYTIWQPSAGAGLHIAGLLIDYAYTSLQTQSNPLYSHIISVRLDINRNRSAAHKGQQSAPAPGNAGTAPADVPQNGAPVVN
jgi:hypothetical protein